VPIEAFGRCDKRLTRSALALTNFDAEWLGEFQSIRATSNGTPLVRGFLNTPAFLDRAAVTEFRVGDGDDKFQTDVEWAFTRRLQLNASLPVNLTDGYAETFNIGSRALLFDDNIGIGGSSNNLIVSLNTDFGIYNSGLENTTSINGWYDIGDSWSAQTNIGYQWLERDGFSNGMLWTAGLGKSLELGNTGRWDFVTEAGYLKNDWQWSIGAVKALPQNNDITLRAAVVRNFDKGDWNLLVGIGWRL